MQIISHPAPGPLPDKPCVATVGFFDGVHRGHRFLIDRVKETADAKGIQSAVITFPDHPRKVMHSEYTPELLTDSKEKINLLAQTGIDRCILLDFTREIACLSAREFMTRILRDCYHVQTLIAGHDHRFGQNRSKTFDDYLRYGKEIGMDVLLMPAYIHKEQRISSSVIRTELREGRVEFAAEYLGYSYFLNGKVIGGFKIGRTIGFPTANIKVNNPDKLIPANGVYAVHIMLDNDSRQTYLGMLNIGCRPTVSNETTIGIEVHIFDFQADIYGQPVQISFIRRIRSEIKFGSIQELTEQLHRDAAAVKAILRIDPKSR